MAPRIDLLTDERTITYSPMGLRLVDDVTGQAPFGAFDFKLELEVGPNQWQTTDLKPVVTSSAVVTFPGLGRVRDVQQPARSYRFQLKAEYYQPRYPGASMSHFQFDAPPYNDTTPPQPQLLGPGDVILLPKANYPFEAGVPVLRGRVLDAAGAPLAEAEVALGATRHVFSDERGEFALPLPHVPPNTPTNIDVSHAATNQQKTIQVTLPADLTASKDITLP